MQDALRREIAYRRGYCCWDVDHAEETPEAPANPLETDQDIETGDVPLPEVTLEDIDCIAFTYQEEAQAILDQDPTDPHNLGPSGDGVACSSLPSQLTVTQPPSTGTGTMASRIAVPAQPVALQVKLQTCDSKSGSTMMLPLASTRSLSA